MGTLLQRLLEFLSIEFTVMITAMLPVIELRGAIPVGISLGLGPIHAAVISFIGSMIPVPFILFSIRPIFKYMRRTRLFNSLARGLTDRSVNNSERIRKYGTWGLVLIVAIPLPGTGVWSGSLVAALMNIRFKWAFAAIFLGNLIAAILVMTLSHGMLNVVNKAGLYIF